MDEPCRALDPLARRLVERGAVQHITETPIQKLTAKPACEISQVDLVL